MQARELEVDGFLSLRGSVSSSVSEAAFCFFWSVFLGSALGAGNTRQVLPPWKFRSSWGGQVMGSALKRVG